MRSIKLFASRLADICLEGQEMNRIIQEKENAKKEEAKREEAKKAEAKKAEAKKAEAKKAEAKESTKEKPAPADLPESTPVASDNGKS
jgi:topoisomerase IA-like protein